MNPKNCRERVNRAVHDLFLSPSFATFMAATAACAAAFLEGLRWLRRRVVSLTADQLMEGMVAAAIVLLLAAIAVPQLQRAHACKDPSKWVVDVAASSGRAAITFNTRCRVSPQQALDLLEQVANERRLVLVPESWRVESTTNSVHRVWFAYQDVTGGAAHEHHQGR